MAGIEDVRVHDLRHTYASHVIIKVVTVPMVSKLLGHRKTSMTLRYTHVSDQDTIEAAERIGATLRDFLQGKMPKLKRDRAAREKTNPDGSPKKQVLIPGKLRDKEKANARAKSKPVMERKPRRDYTSVDIRLNEAELAAASVKAKAAGLSLGQWAKTILDNPPEQLPPANTRISSQAGGGGSLVGFRVHCSEKETYLQLAEKAGHSVSWWARLALLG